MRVEEDEVVFLLRTVDVIRVNGEAPAHGLPDLRIMAGLVQTGIAFQNVKQGIHGLIGHDAVFRELLVRFRTPVDGEGFQISFLIRAVLFDEMEDAEGQLQGFLIARKTVIGAKSVQGKSLVIGVLCGIGRLAVIGDRPENAAVFFIHTVF